MHNEDVVRVYQNVECRMSNVELRYSIILTIIKRRSVATAIIRQYSFVISQLLGLRVGVNRRWERFLAAMSCHHIISRLESRSHDQLIEKLR